MLTELHLLTGIASNTCVVAFMLWFAVQVFQKIFSLYIHNKGKHRSTTSITDASRNNASRQQNERKANTSCC